MLKSIATSSLCITILASLAPRTQAQSTTFSPKLPLSLQPQLQIPSFPKSSINSLPPKEPFLIKKIEVRGNTVLQSEISQLVKQLENKKVTFEDLTKVCSEITQFYKAKGYINSGAFLPTNQNFNNGVVKIQTVEGKLEKIQVSGLKNIQEKKNIQENDRVLNIVSRCLSLKTPLKRQDIAKALRLIQLVPWVEKVNAKLTVGNIPTDNILLINIKEKIRDDT